MLEAKVWLIRCQVCGVDPSRVFTKEPDEKVLQLHSFNCHGEGKAHDGKDAWVKAVSTVLMGEDEFIKDLPEPDKQEVTDSSGFTFPPITFFGVGTVTDPQSFPDPLHPPKQPPPLSPEEAARMSNPPNDGPDWTPTIGPDT